MILKMMNCKQTILFALIIVLLGYIIFTTNDIKTDVGLYNQKIDSIQHNVDSAVKVNKQADIKLSKIDTTISVINNEINRVEKNITIIKNQTNEKINSVDKFSHVELEQFFSNRYK